MFQENISQADLISALEERSRWVEDYILHPRFTERFHPQEMRWAVSAYVRYGGKRLRPGILLFSAGAVGGDEKKAIPAAAAVEIFHTWTLVHDDIIDRDTLRRGRETIHHYFYQTTIEDGRSHYHLEPTEAHHYGVSLAILTGDIQHGWGIAMMTELTQQCGIDPRITLALIEELDTKVLNTLVEGEVLDIQFSYRPVDSLTPELIEEMLWKKTGALYAFCGRAGARIGLERLEHPYVSALSQFAALCGTAFQLQDDILGIAGDPITVGKPVGSDLREGKKTLVLYYAWQNATSAEKEFLNHILGCPDVDEASVQEASELLRRRGGISQVAERARQLVNQGLSYLEAIPPSPYREFLSQWAEFILTRSF